MSTNSQLFRRARSIYVNATGVVAAKRPRFASWIEELESRLLLATVPLVYFDAVESFDVNGSPRSLTMGDFNSDGHTDLVMANVETNSVNVLLGNGDGTFQAKRDYPAGDRPQSVAVGDFNGDGTEDLAVANFGSYSVRVFLNTGDGAFRHAGDLALGVRPNSVAVGEFNGDGIDDLAVASADGSLGIVLLGKGDGGFQTERYYTVGYTQSSVAVADLNDDGNSDLVTLNYPWSVTALLGDGAGNFQQASYTYVAHNPSAVFIADLNRDAKRDLVIASRDAVTVLLGMGDGTFRAATSYNTPPDLFGVVVSDLDGDGAEDVAVASTNGNAVSVLLGNGDGTLQPRRDYIGHAGAVSLVAGDFNEDGKNDIAVAGAYGTVNVLLGRADGTLQKPTDHVASNYPYGIAAGDFNSDGFDDLAVASSVENTIGILLSNGDSTFQPRIDHVVGRYPVALVASDFNRDGITDLAVTMRGEITLLRVLLGNGDGTFHAGYQYPVVSSPDSVVVGDYNGDGKSDLAVVGGYGALSVFLGYGDGTFRPTASGGTEGYAESLAVGDFNGDGRSDLAAASRETNTVNVILSNGDGTFQTVTKWAVGSGPMGVSAGDFNSDGNTDLVVTNSGSNTLSVLFGNGDGRFEEKYDYEVGQGPYSVAISDLNNDGKVDIALVNRSSHSVTMLLGTGDGRFLARRDYLAGRDPLSLAVGDFNGDGRSDLAVTNYYASYDTGSARVTILLNNSVNRPPADILISDNRIAEHQAIGTFVATLLAMDPDTGNSFAYSLVHGEGATGNPLFRIVANQLLAAAEFDHSTQRSYSIRIRATDQGGLYVERQVTIEIADVNETPTGLELSSASVAENEVVGTIVGTFSSIDPDLWNVFTYSLVDGEQAVHNALFRIEGDRLLTATSFNYEQADTYTIRVRTIDQGGLFFESVFAIRIADLNEAPIGVTISADSIPENSPAGSTVGYLAAVDPDAGDVFTYSLISGGAPNDNERFAIIRNQLIALSSFDYEGKDRYSLLVRVTDAAGLFHDAVVSIQVTNVNESPVVTDFGQEVIAGTSTLISPRTQIIYRDPDGDPLVALRVITLPLHGTLSLGWDAVVANQEIPASQLNQLFYLADRGFAGSDSFRWTAFDGESWALGPAFAIISVSPLNHGPTGIELNGSSVAENQPAGTRVGEFFTVDPDTGDGFSYALISGPGDADNAWFVIDTNGRLLTAGAFDRESGRATYSILVRATDQGGLSVHKAFSISVTNVNEAPTVLSLSASSVAENEPAQTLVGSLSAIDPDAGDVLAFSLVPGIGSADNASFTISGNELRTAAPFDFESKARYSVRVRVTDQQGLFLDKVFAISVVDIAETATPWVIRGTHNHDNVYLDQQGTSLVLTINDGVVVKPLDLVSAITIEGLEGDDRIVVSARVTRGVLIFGGDGDDTILGGAGHDTVYGNLGADVIRGGSGNDLILAGLGADSVEGDDGNDSIWGGDQSDTIRGGDGDDYIEGKGKADLLYGDAGDDSVLGMAGNDTIYGNFGNDQLYGNGGDDSIMGGVGADLIDGDDGNDSIWGGDQSDTIYGGGGDDYIDGKGKADTIYGGMGSDTVIGGAGADLIWGDEGDDLLDATPHLLFRDTVVGGLGYDRYIADDNDLLEQLEERLIA